MVIFRPESRVAYCKTLAGAQQLVNFLTERFTGNPQFVGSIRFRSIIETSGEKTEGAK